MSLNRVRATLTAFMLMASVVAGACVNGDDTGRLTPERGDTTLDDDYPEDEREIRAGREATARTDLLLEVSADEHQLQPGDVVELAFVVTSIDSDFVNAPVITVLLPVGVTASNVPAECEPSDGKLECLVVESITSLSGEVPVSAEPFAVRLQISPEAPPGVFVVEAVVESLDNPVTNDPDPGNNTVIVELTVG